MLQASVRACWALARSDCKRLPEGMFNRFLAMAAAWYGSEGRALDSSASSCCWLSKRMMRVAFGVITACDLSVKTQTPAWVRVGLNRKASDSNQGRDMKIGRWWGFMVLYRRWAQVQETRIRNQEQ